MRMWVAPLFVLGALAACSASNDASKSGTLKVTVAGDAEALGGFAFPPASPDEPAFVDGWQVKLDRVLVTVDNVTLADDPDTSPTDQAQTGAVVATLRGPWAIDVAHPGTREAGTRVRDEGDGLNAEAQTLGTIGDELDPSKRYAFGFDLVPASTAAKKTNLDGPGEADYAEMVAKGIAVLYVGTATFEGGDACVSPEEKTRPFPELPRSVRFRFGFATPTQYRNCQNTSLRGRAFAGEEAQRGVQVAEHGVTVAQITVHVDHPFWDTVDHDAAQLFFDPIAAAANADGEVTLDDLARQDVTGFTDPKGEPLPWRSCLPNRPVRTGTRKYDPGSVPVDRAGAPENALRSYADFVRYLQSTQGHLDADGLCAIKRLFPAPR